MLLWARLAALGFVGILCGLAQQGTPAPSQSEPSQSEPSQRELEWRQDLQFLTAGLKAPGLRIAGGLATRGQKDFELLYPNFDKEIESLQADLSRLDDAEILLRVMRIVASAHVAHNRVQIPLGMGFLTRLPLTFYWFTDGLAVTAAAPEYSAALGARVLSIGGLSPEKFLTDLEPYVSYENDAELHHNAPDLMPARGVLQHFGMVDQENRVRLQLERPDRELLNISVPLAPGSVKKTGVAEALHISATFYRVDFGKYYFYRYLSDSQTLYIQYNVCGNDPKMHFDGFVRQMFADSDAHTVKRVVIDLRRNGGGNSRVIDPLKNALASRLKTVGPVYVLIGPATFSSAVDNAGQLRRALSARLVGEPSGGMPGGYGEVSTLTLPNSKLVIRYTTKNRGTKGAGATALVPDIPAPLKLEDFLAGRDPALDAAIHN